MKCDLCGSKKNVRAFYGTIAKGYYKECRKCFEIAFRKGCEMAHLPCTSESMEVEWNRGCTVIRSDDGKR